MTNESTRATAAPELLPCPMCNGAASMHEMEDYFMVACECGVNYEGPTPEDCTEAWNLRPPSPSTGGEPAPNEWSFDGGKTWTPDPAVPSDMFGSPDILSRYVPGGGEPATDSAGREPDAWRFKRDSQAYPGVPQDEWHFIEHGKNALELQGKRGYAASTSHLCWEPMFAAREPAPEWWHRLNERMPAESAPVAPALDVEASFQKWWKEPKPSTGRAPCSFMDEPSARAAWFDRGAAPAAPGLDVEAERREFEAWLERADEPNKCCQEAWKDGRAARTAAPAAPPEQPKGVIPRESNDKLLALARHWKLDGDWMTCKGCKRSLIASRDGEELNHADGCKFAAQQHPWAQLRALIAPSSPPVGTQEQNT